MPDLAQLNQTLDAIYTVGIALGVSAILLRMKKWEKTVEKNLQGISDDIDGMHTDMLRHENNTAGLRQDVISICKRWEDWDESQKEQASLVMGGNGVDRARHSIQNLKEVAELSVRTPQLYLVIDYIEHDEQTEIDQTIKVYYKDEEVGRTDMCNYRNVAGVDMMAVKLVMKACNPDERMHLGHLIGSTQYFEIDHDDFLLKE